MIWVTAAGLALSAALAAPEAGAQTVVTDTIRGAEESFVDVLPGCEGGPLYSVHAAETQEGVEQFILLNTGTFTATPLDPALPDVTGRFTAWEQFNINNQVVMGTRP